MNSEAEQWIYSYVRPIGPIRLESEQPWATVSSVATADGRVWFKQCARVQSFEPRLSAALSERWPDRVAHVLAYDDDRRWLLLGDAGSLLGLPSGQQGEDGARPEDWLQFLPLYAELQRGEAAFVAHHLEHGVPDLRVELLPAHYDALLEGELPIGSSDRQKLKAFARQFSAMCDELSGAGIPATIQHDDVHGGNLYRRRASGPRRLTSVGAYRLLDWGDSCISHPFLSLVSNFRLLKYPDELRLEDPWRNRLRDAYLEPWGTGHVETFSLALRIGAFAHAIAWSRQREALSPPQRLEFDRHYHDVLRAAVAQTILG